MSRGRRKRDYGSDPKGDHTSRRDAERWARQSGATFEADKTSFIHFTKRAGKDDTRALQFRDTTILPQGSVKVLGVTLDKKLAMDEHLSRVITRVREGVYRCRQSKALDQLR
jgi:hypothetical protein